MVEIKGFNEAYKAMLAKETVKKIHKKHTDNRVKELIAQGVDKEIAKVMARDFLLSASAHTNCAPPWKYRPRSWKDPF